MNDTFRMMYFKKGAEVYHGVFRHTVDHITVRGMDLYVHLTGVPMPVLADDLYCEPTVFTLKRVE